VIDGVKVDAEDGGEVATAVVVVVVAVVVASVAVVVVGEAVVVASVTAVVVASLVLVGDVVVSVAVGVLSDVELPRVPTCPKAPAATRPATNNTTRPIPIFNWRCLRV
jgi:hypothetical protein